MPSPRSPGAQRPPARAERRTARARCPTGAPMIAACRRSWSAPARRRCSRRATRAARATMVPMPPFQPKAHGAGAGADRSLPPPARSMRAVERRAHVLRRDRARADVVERAVVRLADHRVDRAHVLHAGLREHPADHRVGRLPDAERAGEQDRRLELAELAHLRRAERACRSRCRRRPPPARAPGRGCRRAAGSR